jgi:hypothetical protein
MATESDNVNSGALVTLLFVGAFAMLGIALVVTALVRTETTEEAEKKEVGADRPYRDLVAEQTAKMAAPAAYLDRGKGSVSLPIDRAMELVVSGLTKDPNSATPPAPIGGTGGTGGTAATEAGGTATTEAGGSGGTAGTAPEGEAKPAEEATHAEGGKPAVEEKKDEKKKDEKKKDEKKKDAPKHVPPVPAAPVPAAPAPAAPVPPPLPK